MMLEYVFFDKRPRKVFLDSVHALAVETKCYDKNEEYFVSIRDDFPQDMNDRIETCYEATFQMSEDLMASSDTENHRVLVGVEVHSQQGRSMASVDAAVLKKMMSVIDYDELAGFVDAIVFAVEHYDDRPICHKGEGDTNVA